MTMGGLGLTAIQIYLLLTMKHMIELYYKFIITNTFNTLQYFIQLERPKITCKTAALKILFPNH